MNMYHGKNNLAYVRILYFLFLFLMIQSSGYFMSWAQFPKEFWHPNGFLIFFSEAPIDPKNMWLLNTIWKTALVFSATGLFYKFMAPLAVVTGLIIVNYSHSFGYQGHVYMPCVLMGLPLAFSHASQTLSLDSIFSRKKLIADVASDKFVFFNMQLIFCIVFFMAGLSKLMNSGLGWIFSDTLRNYILRGQIIFNDTNPALNHFSYVGRFLYQHPYLCQFLAGLTIMIEIGTPLSLISKKLSYVFICLLVILQIGIYFTIGVNFKPYLILYLCWLPHIIDLWSQKK